MKYDNTLSLDNTIEIINTLNLDRVAPSLKLSIDLLDIDSTIDYDLGKSYLHMYGYNVIGNSFNVAKFLSEAVSTPITNGVKLQDALVIEQPGDLDDYIIGIKGRIFLTNNTFYDFNKEAIENTEPLIFNFQY